MKVLFFVKYIANKISMALRFFVMYIKFVIYIKKVKTISGRRYVDLVMYSHVLMRCKGGLYDKR